MSASRPVRRASFWGRVADGLMRAGLVSAHVLAGAREGVHRTADGVPVRYLHLRRPRRPRAVFLHGFSDRPETFLLTASRLRDYDIVLPALPGFHDALHPERRYEVARYAHWVGSLLDDLGVRDAHLCGNSLGGATGLLLAVERPDLVRTLLPLDSAGVEVPGVSSVHDEIRDGANLFALERPEQVSDFLHRIFHRPPPLGPIGRLIGAQLVHKAPTYAHIMAHLAEEGQRHAHRGALVDLDAIRQPTLVAWGDSDSLFPVQIGEHLAARIPQARLHVFDQTGHCPHLERPFALAKLCRDFWAEHNAALVTR